MAILIQCSMAEVFTLMKALAGAAAEAARAGELARHERLLSGLYTVAQGRPFIATAAGARLLSDLLLREGIERKDMEAASAILSRLEAARVSA